MAEETEIAWTRSTFNSWIGCQKVGPGCDNCYAEAMDARKVFGGDIHFGPQVPRLRTKVSNWNQVRRWNKQAPESEFAGIKGFWPVFCASLADVFDNEVDPAWREDFWKLVRECPNLTFQVLTKRIGNAAKMLPPDWGNGYPNVWLGATIVNQVEADRYISKLLTIPAAKRFLSMEPLLGPVDLTKLEDGIYDGALDSLRGRFKWRSGEVTKEPSAIDWVVVGGESGPHARPMHPIWVRSLRDQCAAAGVSFLFKQWGEWAEGSAFPGGDLGGEMRRGTVQHLHAPGNPEGFFRKGDCYVRKVGKKTAGRLLDGVLHSEFPHGVSIQEGVAT